MPILSCFMYSLSCNAYPVLKVIVRLSCTMFMFNLCCTRFRWKAYATRSFMKSLSCILFLGKAYPTLLYGKSILINGHVLLCILCYTMFPGRPVLHTNSRKACLHFKFEVTLSCTLISRKRFFMKNLL